MAQLAIKGNKTSGWLVISLLKMMGGKDNIIPCDGTGGFCYFIDSDGIIKYQTKWNKDDARFKQYTYGEFVEDFPYKVGDEVRLGVPDEVRITNMYWDSCSDQVIYEALSVNGGREYDNLHAKQLSPCKEQTSPDKTKAPSLEGQDYSEGRCSYKIPEGFEFEKVENDEIILKPKKKALPKTYEECCEVIGISRHDVEIDLPQPYQQNMFNLFKLLICRDAYWKLADEWKPVHQSGKDNTFYTINRFNNGIIKSKTSHRHSLLEFSTAEMRDTFYENFENLINECKELL